MNKVTVEEYHNDGEELIRSETVMSDPIEIWILVEGYVDFHGQSELIMLCHDETELALYIWADKNQEDYTHRISLEGAKAHT